MKYYFLIILIFMLIFNLYSLNINLKNTCWKGFQINHEFYYIIFTSDSTYISYSCDWDGKAFGNYSAINDSIFFHQLKGEYDYEFPVGSKHRVGEKKYYMYYANNTLIPKNLILTNGLRYDKIDDKYYDWSYKLIEDYQYNKMNNNDPFFSYIPNLWPTKWEFRSGDDVLTISFEYYKSYYFQKNNSLEYAGTTYSVKDTLYFETPTIYGLGVKPDKKYDGKEFINGIMALKFHNGKLIGVSKESEHLVYEKITSNNEK